MIRVQCYFFLDRLGRGALGMMCQSQGVISVLRWYLAGGLWSYNLNLSVKWSWTQNRWKLTITKKIKLTFCHLPIMFRISPNYKGNILLRKIQFVICRCFAVSYRKKSANVIKEAISWHLHEMEGLGGSKLSGLSFAENTAAIHLLLGSFYVTARTLFLAYILFY